MNYKYSQKEDVWDKDIKEEEKADKSVKPVLLDQLSFNTEGTNDDLNFYI